MSEQGSPTDLLTSAGAGQSVGSQAQFGQLLQILTKMLQALGGNGTSGSTFAYKGAPITSTTYNITAADAFLPFDTTAAGITANLPDATTVPGKAYWLKKVDGSTNQVAVTAHSGQTIDGVPVLYLVSPSLPQMIQSNGANWWIFTTS